MEQQIKDYAKRVIDEAEKKAGLKVDTDTRVLLESIIIVNAKYFYERGLVDGVKEVSEKNKK